MIEKGRPEGTPLISMLGEDNVLRGMDSGWYGGAQPLVDAFRRLRIPDLAWARTVVERYRAGQVEGLG